MKKILITDASENMIIAQPIYSCTGDVLFESGHSLNNVDFTTLQVWGIKEITVVKTNVSNEESFEVPDFDEEEQKKATQQNLDEQLQKI